MKPATKQQALNLFETHRKEFLEHCRWVAVRIAKDKGNVTIDDVRDECPLPLNIDGRVYGAVFASEEFEIVGHTKTRIKSSHGRLVGVYTLKPEYRNYKQPSLVDGKQTSFL